MTRVLEAVGGSSYLPGVVTLRTVTGAKLTSNPARNQYQCNKDLSVLYYMASRGKEGLQKLQKGVVLFLGSRGAGGCWCSEGVD